MKVRIRFILSSVAVITLVLTGIYSYLFFLRPQDRLSVLFRDPQRIADLQAVVHDEPRSPEWRLRLAEAYVDEGHFLTAVEALDQALELGADERRVRHLRRSCWMQLARPHLALEESRQLERLDPDALGPKLAVAYSLLDLDDSAAARKLLRSIPLDAEGRPLLERSTLESRERLFRSLDGLKLRMAASDLKALESDPAQQRESLLTAFVRAGDWESVLSLGRLAMRHSPERIGGRVATGQALLALGRPAEAVTCFKPLRESADFRYMTAVCLLARNGPGDREAAVSDLEAAVKQQPELGRAWWELARLRGERGEWLRAAECYVRANALGVEAPRAARLAAEAFGRAGVPELRELHLGVYYQGSGQPAQGLQLYRKRLAANPDDRLAYRQVAGALGALERTSERIRVLEAGHRRFPEDPELIVSLARTYTEQNMSDSALQLLRRAVTGAAGGSVAVLSTYAAYCNSTGRIEEAETLYRRIIPLTPAAAGPRPLLAALLLRRREDPARLREAISLLEESRRLEPANASVHYELGLAYSYAERNEDAILALRHAVDLDPGEGLPYQPLGHLLRKTGREEEATATLELATRYQQYKKERERLRLLATRKPIQPKALLELASFYYGSSAYAQAGEQLQRYLRLRPGDRDALRRLAEVYGMLGRTLDQAEILRSLGSGRPAPGVKARAA